MLQTLINKGFEAPKLTAGDRNRTGTMSPPQDFKSCASASSATPAFVINLHHKSITHQLINDLKMDGGGFEPPKQIAADLQSVPFGHSGIHPCRINTY